MRWRQGGGVGLDAATLVSASLQKRPVTSSCIKSFSQCVYFTHRQLVYAQDVSVYEPRPFHAAPIRSQLTQPFSQDNRLD